MDEGCMSIIILEIASRKFQRDMVGIIQTRINTKSLKSSRQIIYLSNPPSVDVKSSICILFNDVTHFKTYICQVSLLSLDSVVFHHNHQYHYLFLQLLHIHVMVNDQELHNRFFYISYQHTIYILFIFIPINCTYKNISSHNQKHFFLSNVWYK